MRIKEIRIKGLFGMFDHVIPLNLDTHLSIIYGINGIGKTTVFKMLEYVFNLNESNIINLSKTIFDELDILFVDNTSVNFIRLEKKIDIIVTNTLQETTNYELITDSKEKTKRFNDNVSDIFESIPNIKKIDNNTFENELTKELFTQNEMLQIPQFGRHILKFSQKLTELNKIPQNLQEIASNTKIFYIPTQRLHILYKGDMEEIFERQMLERQEFEKRMFELRGFRDITSKENDNELITQYITVYSQEFSMLIARKQVEYAELAKSLESTLGKRILTKEINTNLDKETLKKIVFEVQKRHSELQEIGLIEISEEEDLTIPDDLDSGTQAVLSVNFQDIQTKLKIYDEIYEKLTLFLEILNQRRFYFKQVFVNQKDGFLVTNDDGVKIALTDLSTGEQHELILLYLLLFKAPENSLILIDEPETSLHIDWQAAFLKDMEDIIKLQKFDILISTHSPSIVNGRQELTIPLYGKKHKQ